MKKPELVTYSSQPYTRSDLRNLNANSYEMHFVRGLWGTNKRTKVTAYDDVIRTNEVAIEKLKKIAIETIKVKETNLPKIKYSVFDRLQINDNPLFRIKNTNKTNIKVTDSVNIKPKNTSREGFSVFDEDERKGNTVIYDIEIDNVASNEETFLEYHNHTTPLNYSNLRPLIPGEYEYQNAIVGVQLKIPPVQGRFGLIGSKLVIDVEDTVEKGRTKLTAGSPTTVRLSKKFYNTPRVLTSLVESDGYGIIEVSYVDKEKFIVGLKSLTNNTEYVSGTIDWLVDGY